MKKQLPAMVGTLVLLCAVSACGASSDDEATAGQSSGSAGQPQGAPGDFAGFPGANGEVAAVSGKTMQVQNAMTGQVAVTWTDATEFTQQVQATLDDVAVGDCVQVIGADAGADSTQGDTSKVTASSVGISKPVDGSCAPSANRGDAPAGPGEAPSDLPSDVPSDLPSDPPSEGAPGGGPGRAGGVFGTVSAVSSDGFTVDSLGQPQQGDTTGTPSIAVSTNAETTYTTAAAATAKAIEVGVCVQARGNEDDTGAVTAESVEVSPKQNGQCAGPFGFGSRPGA